MSRSRKKLPQATISEWSGVRYLHLGSVWVQGAMRLAKPDKVELEYVQRMLAWMLWRPTRALGHGTAVQLGLGAAALTRFTAQRLKMRTLAVELNPSVIAAARAWFRLPEDSPALQVVEADAGEWIAEPAHAGIADVLNVDLYDQEAAAPVLDSAGFYAACRRVLADGGLMTVNLFGRDASFEASLARIVEAFGPTQVWQTSPTREGNAIVVAARGVEPPDREELERRAETIEARFGLPARKWLRLVRPGTVPAKGAKTR